MSKREAYTVCSNVYEALGFPDPAGMHIKARLAMQIADLIKARELSQTQAAKQVGLSQPKLSGLLHGRFRGISEAKMMDCLAALGNDVEIVVRAAAESIGHVHVSVRGSALQRKGLVNSAPAAAPQRANARVSVVDRGKIGPGRHIATR